MAANVNPIFSRTPQIEWGGTPVLAANTTKDLTSGTIYQIFAGDATEGSLLQRIVVQPLGTNVATVLRLFLNNGLTTATAANNTMIDQLGVLATTNSETTAVSAYVFPLILPIPAGYRLYVTCATVVAAGFHVTAIGGRL
jgi:hypothetical protein